MPPFEAIDEVLNSHDPAAAFDYLLDQFRTSKDYGLLFEATLMKKRNELGLPLIQTGDISNPEYQDTVLNAARETGTLFLADNKIDRAWPYFRAIAETEPVREAIDKLQPAQSEPGESADQIAAIAFQEGVHPRKGLEFILARHGMCRAITAFGMTAVSKDRGECIALLARNIHSEIVRRISEAIEANEVSAPATTNLHELMKGRDWLFGEWDYYVDTSHLLSVIPYCMEISDPAVLDVFTELCAYGSKLAPQFHQPGVPPFEDQFTAHAHYIAALRGQDVEEHIGYFREKASTADPEIAGDAPARTLVKLLIALGRNEEALSVLLEGVYEDAPYGTPVPSALQLCYTAKDFRTLRDLARERGDILSYTAGSILVKTGTFENS